MLPPSTLDGDPVVVRLDGTVSEQRRQATQALGSGRPVVGITTLGAPRELRALTSTGIHGLVWAEDVDRTLPATLAAVRAGLVCYPGAARVGMATPALTPRQRQVLALVVMGLTDAEMASRLHVAETTVKSHVKLALERIGARNRAEAVELVSDPERTILPGVLRLT